MSQYKCVSAPQNLVIEYDGSVENAVNSYAKIINAEARNGWKFHSLEQISITRNPKPLGCLGSIIAAIFQRKNEAETVLYGMLIFVKDE